MARYSLKRCAQLYYRMNVYCEASQEGVMRRFTTKRFWIDDGGGSWDAQR